MNLIKEKLEKNYPDTPEHFHKLVEREVYKQLQSTAHGEIFKRKRFSKVLIPLAACFILSCSAVIAAGIQEKGIAGWLESLGVNRKEAEPLVEFNPNVVYEETEPLLQIQEFYADGTKLVFTAKADESLNGYEVAAMDHVYVNDVDCMNMGFYPLDKDTDLYECSIDISEVSATDSLHIYLRLYTPDGIQDMKFSVPVESIGATKQIEEYQVMFENALVKMERGSISPTMVNLVLYFECSGENAEENIKILGAPFYKIKDSNGNILDSRYMLSSWGSSVVSSEYQENNGVWSKRSELIIENFDVTSDSITFIPYISDVDELGKSIPDSGVIYDELAFTIPLKETGVE